MQRLWRWVIHLLINRRHYKFREWIDLEDRRIEIDGASDKTTDEFPKLVVKFLSDALALPRWVWARLPWMEVWAAYLGVSVTLSFKGYLPIVSLPTDEKYSKPVWDYPHRSWYFYANLIAKHYGWSLEYIGNLPVFAGMALVQEILLSEQTEREFLWSMSEASVNYDQKTQTTKPNPLPRPYWMKQAKPDEPLPIPKIKIPTHLMPIGVVNYDALSEEYKPKAIDPGSDVGAS